MASCDSIVQIKIGDIIDPRTFWAYETKRLSQSSFIIKNLEALMNKFYAQIQDKVGSSTLEGTLVAIKKDEKWVRGRLLQTYQEKHQLLASVFLIDYGVSVHRVNVDSDLRILDQGFSAERGASFQVILAGLSPVTMDMDWSCGGSVMKASPAEKWDEAALIYIRNILNESNNCEADLVDFVIDSSGRRHGQVLVGHGTCKIHLNEILIEKNFAEHSQWQYENDLMEIEFDLNNNVLNTIPENEDNVDIIGGGEASKVTLEDFENEANSEASITPQSSTSVKAENQTPRNLASVGTCRGRKNILNQSFCSRQIKQSSFGKIDENAASNINCMRPTGNSQRLLTALRRRSNSKVFCVERKEEKDDCDWESIRLNRDKSRDDSSSKVHQLPGGVFIGKYHEEVVAHINKNSSSSSSARDLKEKFEKFVDPDK